jgi:hypothetical protein
MELLIEWLLATFFNCVLHPHSIIVIDKTITKYSNSLMCPQSNDLRGTGQFFFGGSSHTTYNFREISQVESVMSLGWSRFQTCLDFLENFIGSLDNLLFETSYFCVEATLSEMPFKNVPEDNFKSCLIKVDITNLVEMSSHTLSDMSSTTTWWTHGSDKVHLLKMSEWMLIIFSVIPSTLIDPLSKDLNWRLSTIFLDLWHVQIVNEYNTLHSNSWTEMILSQFSEFTINDVLDLIASSLS